jgi:hypothetical protein
LRIDSKLFRNGDALPFSKHPPQGMEGDSTTTVDITPHHDVTGMILGRSLEVRMSSNLSPIESVTKDYVAVLLYVLCSFYFVFFLLMMHVGRVMFSLDIPANNWTILQPRNDLELLPARQHCITNPNVTLCGLYMLGENQFEMLVKDMCADRRLCPSPSRQSLHLACMVFSSRTI